MLLAACVKITKTRKNNLLGQAHFAKVMVSKGMEIKASFFRVSNAYVVQRQETLVLETKQCGFKSHRRYVNRIINPVMGSSD